MTVTSPQKIYQKKFMKINFGEAKGPFKEIEVDPEITADALKTKLIKEFGFREGSYTFIFSGKVLKGDKPIKDIKEKSRVIVFIKSAKPAEPAKTEKQETPKQEAKASQPAPQAAPEQRPAPQQQRPAPQVRPQPQIPGRQRVSTAELIKTVIKALKLENIYNPENNIWDHTAKLAQVTDIVNNNPSHLYQIMFNTLFNTIPGADQSYISNVICLLLDIQVADFNPCQSDVEAKVESMSKAQREIYHSLVSEFKDKDKMKIIEALESTSFNKEEAIKALKI